MVEGLGRGKRMREDDGDQVDRTLRGSGDSLMEPERVSDLFGDYSVVGAGVYVMIDGRDVSAPED